MGTPNSLGPPHAGRPPLTPFPRRRWHVPPPIPPTPLVGRERELAAAVDLLRRAPRVDNGGIVESPPGGDGSSGARLVTLTGAGGIGKTRLALAVAAAIAADFADGVAWVPLATVDEPMGVVPAILDALDVGQDSRRPPLDALLRALGEARLLLLLDNLEQVLAAGGDVADLLAACPGVKVLATSRSPLRLRAERVIPVPPLGLSAPSGRHVDANPAAESAGRPVQSEAVQLFAQRARALDPAFALTGDAETLAAEVCRRLDGLPLAIELAAARLNQLALPTLLERLERRLPLLTGGARELPARQRTLRDTIGWSHQLLTAEEQALFRRLAVFAGGFTLEAAERVAGEGLPDTVDLLGALVDGHLVRHRPEAPGGPRYDLLETIREYADERLAASGEMEALRERHARFYLAFAERNEIVPFVPFDARQMARLEAERANLRVALARFETTGDVVGLRRLVAAVGYFWWLGGHLHEGLPWVEQAMAVADEAAGEAPEVVVRLALPFAAIAAIGGGALDRAERVLATALARARELGNAGGIATTLIVLGFVDNLRGDFERAEQRLEEAVSLARSLADSRSAAAMTGTALRNLGDAVRFQGRLREAAAYCGEGLTLHRSIDDEREVAHDLVDLGLVARDLGDLAGAVSRFQEGLRCSSPGGGRRYVVVTLEGMATVLAVAGGAESAARLFGAADRLREATGVTQDFPADRAANGRAVAAVRAALGGAAFDAAWTAGRALSPDQAVAEALAVSVAAPDPGSAPRRGNRPDGRRGTLSPRELEVARLLVAGRTDRQIGEALFISTRTVEGHVARIFEKLGVRTRSGAVAAAIAAGLVDPPFPGG